MRNLWSKGIGKDRRVGKLSFLEKLRLPQSFAFFAVSGVVSSTPLFLLLKLLPPPLMRVDRQDQWLVH